jgi:hypothetical protein
VTQKRKGLNRQKLKVPRDVSKQRPALYAQKVKDLDEEA